MLNNFTMLSLGDSYTIGEAVAEEDRFPNQAIKLLEKKGVFFEKPIIIAKTGWTTDELMGGIAEKKVNEKFDFVTLLIGVNNQYRQRSLENYEEEFTLLLNIALDFAANDTTRVIVVSIPDWGKTPFLPNDEKHRELEQIAKEIDAFNKINKRIAKKAGVNYIDITKHSRSCVDDLSLIAEDKLHPSGKMYAYWAAKVAKQIAEVLNKE